MKITNVRTYSVAGIRYNWTLVKVMTDADVHGWGEATSYPGQPVVEAACRHLGQILRDEDPFRIEYLWERSFRDFYEVGHSGAMMAAISALDMALWDIKGKAMQQPIYELLGGLFRDRLQLLANLWFIQGSHSPDEYARQAKRVVAREFRALSLDPFTHGDVRYGRAVSTTGLLAEEQKDQAAEIVNAVAEAVGRDLPVAIETHGMLSGPQVQEMATRLEQIPFNCMWLEDPTPAEQPAAMARHRRSTRLPIAAGRGIQNRFHTKTLLDAEACDVIRPSVTRSGGITELRRIAALAGTYNIPVAPVTRGGPLAALASAHVMATIPNFYRLEHVVRDVSYLEAILNHQLPVEHGVLTLPARPGLGVDLNEEELERHPGVRRVSEGELFYL